MASPRYLDSAGSDANGGTSWADAKATLAGIDAIDTTGDTIYVAHTHSESTAAAVSYTFAGTAAAPTKIICGNKAAQPPTTPATSAVIATTGNTSGITWAVASSGIVYTYGLTLDAGQGGNNTASIILSNASSLSFFEACTFKLSSTGASSRIQFGGAAVPCRTEVINCSFQFSSTSQSIQVQSTNAVRIAGGSIVAGTVPSAAFTMNNNAQVLVEGFDLSNCASSMNIASSAVGAVKFVMRNCKLPASWTGSLNASTPGVGSVWEMFNCDSADTHYHYRRATQFGTMQDETTIVRSGGANDGVTTFSYKMASNANAQFPHQPLDSPEFVVYVPPSMVGVSRTATIEFVHDSATALKDTELWAEAFYLGTSGAPLGALADDRGGLLSSGSAQDSSSASWTTTGMTNPNKQKCVVTFTPQEEGYVHLRMRLAKASYTAYVDPVVTVA
jgi:hypothetical protein